MDQNILIAIVIALILTVVMFVVSKRLKASKQNLMISYLQTGKFEEFEKLTNSFLVKMLFPRYNIEYLKLNASILEGDEAKIEEQFDGLLKVKKSKVQTEDITMKAFNYYVGVENKERCSELMETIKGFTNERMVQEATIMYDIFILKKGNHIEEVSKMMEGMPDAQKGVNEYLLAVQYENIGDLENAKKYEMLSKKHLSKPMK